MKKRNLLLLFIILFSVHVFAQNYQNLSFEHIDNTKGLLSDEVYVTVQDKSGFIWFGTAEGIVRYDGYEFKSFKDHPHLGKMYGIQINRIDVDEDGSFYVCTNEGFYAFDKYYEPILQSVEEELKGLKLNYVLKASDGYIYLSSQIGLYVVEPKTNKVTRLRPAEVANMISPVTKQIVEDSRGRIWIASWTNSVLVLNNDKTTLTRHEILKPIPNSMSDMATNALFIDSRGYLWIGNWEMGLYVVDISSDSKVNIIKKFVHEREDENNIAGNIILSITEDSYNNIWIGTPYGLSVIQYPLSKNHKIVNYKPTERPDAVSSAVINDILNDNSNILWVATRGGGVDKLVIDRKKFEHLKIPNLYQQRRNQAVHSFETDLKGRVLAGVLSIGFVVFDVKTKKFKHYKDIPEYKVLDKYVYLNTAKDFMWDRDSLLWIGTRYNGVILLDVKTGEVNVFSNKTKKSVDFRGREANVLCTLPNGSVLVGTDNGLNLLTVGVNRNWKSHYVDLGHIVGLKEGSVKVSGIKPLDDGTILVSSELNGLFKLTLNKGNVDITKWSVIDDKIVCLFKDSRGIVWIGTKGNGLKYIDPKENVVKTLDPEANIMGDVIYGINQDKFGHIWVTTNKGLTKIWNQQHEVSSESYFYRDGLQGNVFLARSFFKDKEDRFYIGGYNGFNIFEPHRVRSNYQKSPVAVTEIQIEGENINVSGLKDSTLYLNHLKNDLSISFASLCYTFPEANKYAYKIEGLDNDWKFASSKMRSANYSNIPAGKYTFLLKGSNSQGVWSDDIVKLGIEVARAPYKSWWAICLYVLSIGLISGLIFRQRLKIERIKQNMELEHVARVKSENLNKYKLSFFTNISHELLTPISILSTSLYNLKSRRAYSEDSVLVMERSISGLERLIRQLLTFRKVENNSMNVKIRKENISEVVNNCVQDFSLVADKKNIEISINIQEGITGKIDKEKWELIIRNLLSNAIKYTQENGKVVYTLKKQKENEVSIMVEDTGCGIPKESLPYLFDRFYRVEKDEEVQTEGIGIGLNLTKSLIDILKGSIRVESEEGVGTKFYIELPIDGSYQKGAVNVDGKEYISEGDVAVSETTSEEPVSIYNVDDINVKGKTILLVEDNEEFRGSLKSALEDTFNILEASDGKKGVEVAEKEEVDLIISDVMMPNMTGHELCQAIKTNIKTSHIPIILLTAKVGDDNKLAGYHSGANSYLEKPVNMNLLLVRIQALLVSFQKQREKTSISLNLEPENISITPLDEDFFNKAKKIVEDNMSDADYSIRTFADELGVSNSMLYRKMKNLASCSPSEFVRNIRLRRAAQLFENKSFQISEVAYKCGFNDLSYFGVCFKKMYGVTPTQYQEGERKEEASGER